MDINIYNWFKWNLFLPLIEWNSFGHTQLFWGADLFTVYIVILKYFVNIYYSLQTLFSLVINYYVQINKLSTVYMNTHMLYREQ